MLEYLPPLNDHNLPYPDTIHPNLVHLTLGLFIVAIAFDIVGHFHYVIYGAAVMGMYAALSNSSLSWLLI
ncbi:MAG: hypothetical protein WBV73_24800 [Phormidium sp.]